MAQGTTHVETLSRDILERTASVDAALSDDLERVIAAAVAAGWRPWRWRRRTRSSSARPALRTPRRS